MTKHEIRKMADLARNPNTPKEVLIKLSKNEYCNIRWNVAEHINTPIEILIELSKDKMWSVRHSVAKNTNTPNEILKQLLNDDLCKENALNTLIKKKNLHLLT